MKKYTMNLPDCQSPVRAYLDKLPPSISGQGGQNALYRAAVCLVQGFALDEETAINFLLAYFNSRCEPEWSVKEIEHKVKDALKNSDGKRRGWLLERKAGSGGNYTPSQSKLPKPPKPKEETPKAVSVFYRQDGQDGYFWRMIKETVYQWGAGGCGIYIGS